MDDPYYRPPPSGGTVLQRSVAVGTSSVLLTGMNAHRVRVSFMPTNANRVWLGFGQAAVVGKGYAIYPGTQPPALSRDTIGDSIISDIFGISEGTGETLPFFEEVG